MAVLGAGALGGITISLLMGLWRIAIGSIRRLMGVS
jgi:hypothetical protein